MQNTISCYLSLVYLKMEWLIDVPIHLNVNEFVSILNTRFPCEFKPLYVYELKSHRILDGKKTFLENEVVSGDYLYVI